MLKNAEYDIAKETGSSEDQISDPFQNKNLKKNLLKQVN